MSDRNNRSWPTAAEVKEARVLATEYPTASLPALFNLTGTTTIKDLVEYVYDLSQKTGIKIPQRCVLSDPPVVPTKPEWAPGTGAPTSNADIEKINVTADGVAAREEF